MNHNSVDGNHALSPRSFLKSAIPETAAFAAASTAAEAATTSDHPLVINWHLTEACNYACTYCYATWNSKPRGRELLHDEAQTRKLLTQLYRFFEPRNPRNPLTQRMHWDSVRLNLAGGEPLLYQDHAIEVIERAKAIGFDVSIISNGSRLSTAVVSRIAPRLSLLGLSLDSFDDTTNRSIGRVRNDGTVCNPQHLADRVERARKLNPNLRLKVNTVVNALNWQQDFSAAMRRFAPERWKVLRMLPVADTRLSVTDEQFRAFVQRHRDIGPTMCIEGNEAMTQSYLMIDPHGRFFQNQPGSAASGYIYSTPILDCGVAEAFSQITFNEQRYTSRYADLTSKRFGTA